MNHIYKYTLGLIFVLFFTFTFASFSQRLPSGPQVLTIHSDLDDREQPYALYIPKSFDESKSYPLVIMLHGAGSNHRLALRRVFGKTNFEGENDLEASRYFPEWEDVDYIVAAPYARGTAGYQGIPEKDVMDILADVQSRFNIDENRIFLTGLSMGGGGTLWIGLTRPDLWAAIAPVCPAPPNGTMELALNALNLPVYFHHGDADPVVPIQISREFTAKMKAGGVDVMLQEYPGVLHDSWANAYENGQIFKWFDNFTRNPFPEKINFSTWQLKYGKAYWLEVIQKTPGELSQVEAEFKNSNTLEIKTNHIQGLKLSPKGHSKFDPSKALNLSIDGQKINLPAAEYYKLFLVNGKWQTENPNLKKTKGSEGPIFQAFSERHVYVYGTADSPSDQELELRRNVAMEAANWSAYRGEFLGRMMFFPRVISDKEVRPSDLKDANLILFGNKETNKWIAEFESHLPMHLSADDKEHGLLYIFPKPQAEQGFVLINSGLPWWTGADPRAFRFTSMVHGNLPDLKDFLLFKQKNDQIVLDGHFDQNWNLSKEQMENFQKSGAVQMR